MASHSSSVESSDGTLSLKTAEVFASGRIDSATHLQNGVLYNIFARSTPRGARYTPTRCLPFAIPAVPWAPLGYSWLLVGRSWVSLGNFFRPLADLLADFGRLWGIKEFITIWERPGWLWHDFLEGWGPPFAKSRRIYVMRTIPFHAIPCRTNPTHSSPFHCLPFHSFPFRNVPFRSIAFHSLPFHWLPYHSMPFDSISLPFTPRRAPVAGFQKSGVGCF